MTSQTQELRREIAELGSTVGERAGEALDAKMVGLAHLVRSDNERLAEQIVSDQEASKQALRAMKELQASLPVELIDSVERRMETLAESMQKSNEMLAQRIDHIAERIGERQDNDIQIVIDRMGDAMHALASLGRASGGGGASVPEVPNAGVEYRVGYVARWNPSTFPSSIRVGRVILIPA